jgi:hypothetical protein
MNKDFIYDYKFRADKRPIDPNYEFDSITIKRLKEFAKANNMSEADLFEKLKNSGSLKAKSSTNGGYFYDKEKFGLNKTEKDVKSRERKQISIEDFAGSKGAAGTEDADLSEREDEDIYTHYIEQMRRAKLEEAQEKPSDKELKGHQRLAEQALKDLENDVL